jgi:hypothetical protein
MSEQPVSDQEATADARLPRPEEQPPATDGPPGTEALPVEQEQPPTFMYGSSAAGTARDGVEPGPVPDGGSTDRPDDDRES